MENTMISDLLQMRLSNFGADVRISLILEREVDM